jgi:hypothetical protein
MLDHNPLFSEFYNRSMDQSALVIFIYGPNLTWEESVKRDLKDWCITKELALDRREWKLAIHVPEH